MNSNIFFIFIILYLSRLQQLGVKKKVLEIYLQTTVLGESGVEFF